MCTDRENPKHSYCKTMFIVTGVTSEERTVLSGVLVALSLVYCSVSCRSLFFLLSFIFLSLCCLSSFEFTDSDFPCAIFKLFFYVHIYRLSCLTVIFFKVTYNTVVHDAVRELPFPLQICIFYCRAAMCGAYSLSLW